MTVPASDDDLPELRFASGLPGFPEAQRFVLVYGADDNPFALLRSLDDPDLAFAVVSPAVFFPDYAPELDDESAARLGLLDTDDALVLVIVTVPERATDATANLLAPVVVNRRTRQASQVVLAGSDYGVRVPLVSR